MKNLTFAAVTLALSISNASACSCQFASLSQNVQDADEIFVATLQRAEVIPSDYPQKWGSLEGTFQSKTTLKGATNIKEIVLATGMGHSGCSIPMFVSATYIIFKAKDQRSIDACGGSSVIESFQKDDVVAKIKTEVARQKNKSQKK